MSYKSRKKKTKLNKVIYLTRLSFVKVLKKIRGKGGKKRMAARYTYPGTVKMMEFLRQKAKSIKINNLRVDAWIGGYLDDCLGEDKAVELLSQLCISVYLKKRYKIQGNRFIPTKKEIELFEERLPEVISAFEKYGFRINWLMTFNRSCLDSGRIRQKLEEEYKEMILGLAEKSPSVQENVMIVNWEEEVIEGRPLPDEDVYENTEKYTGAGAYWIEYKRHERWSRETMKLGQSDQEIDRDVRFQIACSVREGKYLMGDKSASLDGLMEFNGNVILIPLETPEMYDLMEIGASGLKKRVAAVLPFYVWRLPEDR